MSSEEKNTLASNTAPPLTAEALIQFMRLGGVWLKPQTSGAPKSADADFGDKVTKVGIDTFADEVINYGLEKLDLLDGDSPLKSIAGFGVSLLNAAREAYLLSNEYLSEFMERNRIEKAYEKTAEGQYIEVTDFERLKHFANQSDLYAQSSSGEFLPLSELKTYMDSQEGKLINILGAGVGGFSLTELPDMLSILNPGDETTQSYRKFFQNLREQEFQASNPMGFSKIEAEVAKIEQQKAIRDTENSVYDALKAPVMDQAREYARANTTTGVSRQVAEDWYMRENFSEENARAVAKAMGLVKTLLPEKSNAEQEPVSYEPPQSNPQLTNPYDKTFGETLSMMGVILGQLETDGMLSAARNVYDGSTALNGMLAHAEAQGGLTVGSNTINNATSVHVAEVTINSTAQDLTGTGEDFAQGVNNVLNIDNATQAAVA